MTSTTMASDLAREALEPCPFCGGAGDFLETGVWWVRCDDCGADAESSEAKDVAVANWNRRARTAYDAIGSRVKALEWRKGLCDEECTIEQAHTIGGLMQVRQYRGKVWFDRADGSKEEFASVDEAKAAAQADFERRVLSCLSTHTAAGAGPVGEAVADFDGWLSEVDERGALGDKLARLSPIEAARQAWSAALSYVRPVEEPGEVERITRERDELQRDLDECCDARDGAGFLGSVPDCIEWLKDERAAAEAALAETRERLEKVEAAARPLAEIADEYSPEEDEEHQVWKDFDALGASLPLKRFRALRAALTGDAQEAGR